MADINNTTCHSIREVTHFVFLKDAEHLYAILTNRIPKTTTFSLLEGIILLKRQF